MRDLDDSDIKSSDNEILTDTEDDTMRLLKKSAKRVKICERLVQDKEDLLHDLETALKELRTEKEHLENDKILD